MRNKRTSNDGSRLTGESSEILLARKERPLNGFSSLKGFSCFRYRACGSLVLPARSVQSLPYIAFKEAT
jgi:hypothetical protein